MMGYVIREVFFYLKDLQSHTQKKECHHIFCTYNRRHDINDINPKQRTYTGTMSTLRTAYYITGGSFYP